MRIQLRELMRRLLIHYIACMGPRLVQAIPVAGLTVATALVATGAVFLLRQRPPPPSPSLERTFSYSILVQRYSGQKALGAPVLLPGERIFQADSRIRFLVSSPQFGHLYILNEGPARAGGLPSYNMMFPPSDGAAQLSAHRVIQFPAEPDWIRLDAQEGSKKLWMVWSAEMVAELESARRVGRVEEQGGVSDPAHIRVIRVLLEKHQGAPPKVNRDEENKQTHVLGRGSMLVKLLKLEHHY